MKTATREQFATALLREIDRSLQIHYRQSLREVVTELRVRHQLTGSDPSPSELLAALRKTHMFHVIPGKQNAAIAEALERFATGNFGRCVRCGRQIPVRMLEKNPLIVECTGCRARQPNGRNQRTAPNS